MLQTAQVISQTHVRYTMDKVMRVTAILDLDLAVVAATTVGILGTCVSTSTNNFAEGSQHTAPSSVDDKVISSHRRYT